MISENFNENHEKFVSPNYALDTCYLYDKRSDPEKEFEKILKKNINVTWWYKSGDSKEAYLGIPYIGEDKAEHTFYPDFIVKFKNGSVGIYDTKSGITAKGENAAAKSNALQAYINQNKKLKLKGGLVVVDRTGAHVFTGEIFNEHRDDKKWELIEW